MTRLIILGGLIVVSLLGGGVAYFLVPSGEEAIEDVLTLHRRLSAFERSSELARVNREGGSGWVAISRDLVDLLNICRQAFELSGGAFDPTVGPLMKAWGFRGGRCYRLRGRKPWRSEPHYGRGRACLKKPATCAA